MQPTFGGLGLIGLRTKHFASGAEPVQPGFVFGTELFGEFFPQTLRESGAFAIGGDGDLQVAALHDGTVVEVAVIDIVDSVAEGALRFGREKYRAIEFTQRRGGNDEEGALKIGGFEMFRKPLYTQIAYPFGDLGCDLRGDYAHASAGLQQAGDLVG